MQGAMLALPDVTELVRDQIVGGVCVLQQDRAPEGVAAVPAEARDPEEPGCDVDPEAVDSHRLGVPLERVEAFLRALEPRGEVASHSRRA